MPEEIEIKRNYSDLDAMIQKLMDAKNKYGNRPVVIEGTDSDGWYEDIEIVCDDIENPSGPIFIRPR